MAIICPTITAENAHVYREQIERVEPFAERIHIDLMDGRFTPNQSLALEQVWWPKQIMADIHLMFEEPEAQLETLIELKPNMVIFHAESTKNVPELVDKLKLAGIKTGLALLPETTVASVEPILPLINQALIFSGNLGYQGGSSVNFDLLDKVEKIKQVNPQIEEIAWDGGVNADNVRQLIGGGIEVVNVGGFIHFAKNPEAAFLKLRTL